MNVEKEVEQLKEEIEKIKARNKKVEADKAWETSAIRRVFNALSTYVVIFVFMILINDDYPLLKALLATATYLISTFSYGVLKKWWLQKRST